MLAVLAAGALQLFRGPLAEWLYAAPPAANAADTSAAAAMEHEAQEDATGADEEAEGGFNGIGF